MIEVKLKKKKLYNSSTTLDGLALTKNAITCVGQKIVKIPVMDNVKTKTLAGTAI